MGDSGIKLGLDRIRELMHMLGDPQDRLKFIHVAGTNGKGSTCSFISAMLTANGYKVGMYTSPAVEDVREQYTINGDWISSEDYALYLAEIYAAMIGRTAEEAFDEPSFRLADKADSGKREKSKESVPTSFEIETALAFLYFYKNNCDYVVLETGLGGEGDATNIVNTTVLSVLTSISEDHLGMIGNNIEEIARTKAGIIKPGVPVVMIENGQTVGRVIEEECRLKGSELYIVQKQEIVSKLSRKTEPASSQAAPDVLVSGLGQEDSKKQDDNIRICAEGSYQADNAALAIKALDVLCSSNADLKLDEEKSREALRSVRIPYRMERICEHPLFYVDGAHNPDAAKRLRETLENRFEGYRIIFIMGMFRDKDYREVVRITAPLADRIFTVQTPDSPRALSAEELRQCILEEVTELTESSVSATGIDEAVTQSISACAEYEEQDTKACIIAFGSLSYLRYIKAYICDKT